MRQGWRREYSASIVIYRPLLIVVFVKKRVAGVLRGSGLGLFSFPVCVNDVRFRFPCLVVVLAGFLTHRKISQNNSNRSVDLEIGFVLDVRHVSRLSIPSGIVVYEKFLAFV